MSRAGNVVSDKPVEVKMLNGTLNANRLEVADKGDVVALRRRRGDEPDARHAARDDAKAATR